jgi:hypothetical protein
MIRNVLLFIGLIGAPSAALALDIACPEKIVTTQVLGESVVGWKEFVRPGREAEKGHWSRPSRIDLYYGDPKDIAQLVPDNEEDIWTFSRPSTPERPIYMACVYSDTYVQFVKALPPNIKKCIANQGVLDCEEFKP